MEVSGLLKKLDSNIDEFAQLNHDFKIFSTDFESLEKYIHDQYEEFSNKHNVIIKEIEEKDSEIRDIYNQLIKFKEEFTIYKSELETKFLKLDDYAKLSDNLSKVNTAISTLKKQVEKDFDRVVKFIQNMILKFEGKIKIAQENHQNDIYQITDNLQKNANDLKSSISEFEDRFQRNAMSFQELKTSIKDMENVFEGKFSNLKKLISLNERNFKQKIKTINMIHYIIEAFIIIMILLLLLIK